METLDSFLQLAWWSAGWCLAAFSITVPLALLGLWAGIRSVKGARDSTLMSIGIAGLPIVLPFAMLVLGTVYANPGSSNAKVDYWAEGAVTALLVAQLPLAFVLYRWNPRARWLGVSISSFAAAYSIGVSAICWMSISGDWV